MEIHGLLTLFITDETYGRVRVQVIMISFKINYPRLIVYVRFCRRLKTEIIVVFKFKLIPMSTKNFSVLNSTSH